MPKTKSAEPRYFYSRRFYDDAERVAELRSQDPSQRENAQQKDDDRSALYEYRYVVPLDSNFPNRYYALNKPIRAPGNRELLTEAEATAVGIVQSPGWQHVAFFDGFATLVFRRLRTDNV